MMTCNTHVAMMTCVCACGLGARADQSNDEPMAKLDDEEEEEENRGMSLRSRYATNAGPQRTEYVPKLLGAKQQPCHNQAPKAPQPKPGGRAGTHHEKTVHPEVQHKCQRIEVSGIETGKLPKKRAPEHIMALNVNATTQRHPHNGIKCQRN